MGCGPALQSGKGTLAVGVSVPTAVPKTTAETLRHKINPSAGETAPQAVDVLLYTPGKQLSLLVTEAVCTASRA